MESEAMAVSEKTHLKDDRGQIGVIRTSWIADIVAEERRIALPLKYNLMNYLKKENGEKKIL